MGVANVPASAGGGIKTVQRGSAGASGNVTITAVDIAKSFVTVFGSASSGTVAASGAINADSGNIAATSGNTNPPRLSGGSAFGNWKYEVNNGSTSTLNLPVNMGATTFTGSSTNITGGTNNLVAAVVTGFLANSTTLTVSGACRFEVVEFA